MTAYEMRISDWSSDVCSSDRAAYNDAAGVTAAFTLNLLTRINRELDGDFDLAQLAHRAQYNAMAGRIETAIISRRAQDDCVASTHYHFAAGEDRKSVVKRKGVTVRGDPGGGRIIKNKK